MAAKNRRRTVRLEVDDRFESRTTEDTPPDIRQGHRQRRTSDEFVEVGTVNADVREQLFRRLVLTGLHRGERLSAEFRDTLERTLIVKR